MNPGLAEGLRLCLFEVVWPRPWLKAIELKELSSQTYLFNILSNRQPSEEEWNSLGDRIREIADIAFEDSVPSPALKIQLSRTSEPNSVKLMDDEEFRRIAKEIAPWRLNSE